MKQYINRRLAALILCAVMVVSLAIAIYASTSDAVTYITSVSVKNYSKTNKTFDLVVKLTGIYEELGETPIAVIRPETTIKATSGSKAVDGWVSLALGSSKEISPSQHAGYYTVTFDKMAFSTGTHTISFYLTRTDGSYIVLTRNFTLSSSGSIGSGSTSSGGSSGSSSDDDDDDDEKPPIAALKPHLIVDGYSYDQAVAGQDVTVSFTLKNTSINKTMRNVVLTIKPSGDLRIKSASDTIYIDSIEPRKTVTKSLKFTLPASAKTPVQDIGIASTFEYFDIEGQNAVSGGDSISVSIPTATVERVRIQKVDLPEMLYPNAEEEIAYSIINTGFTTLYNCEIKVVDEAGTEYAYAYVGSIEPSKAVTEPYLPVLFQESGEKSLKFILTYENDQLKVQEVVRDFTANVMEMPVFEPPIFEPPIDEPLPEQGMAPWLMWSLIGGGAVVLIIIIAVIVKVVKKRRDAFDDEDI